MRTNIVIDDQLMAKARQATGLTTQRATVDAALRLLVATHGQAGFRKLRGKVRWEGNLEESRTSRVVEKGRR
jgi:Arc/MetJ family transcription regulator